MTSKQDSYGKTASGVPITDDLVNKLAAKAEAGYDPGEMVVVKGPGRPAIGSAPSRTESVRLGPELRAAVAEKASRDHVSPSEVIRRAVRGYVQRG